MPSPRGAAASVGPVGYALATMPAPALDQVQHALRQAGAIARPLARADLAGWIERWKDAFAATGTRLPYLWEAFTAEHAVVAKRDEAQRAYQQAAGEAHDLVALGAAGGWGLEWSGVVLLERGLCDVVIVPTNLSWTLACTHHDHLGPYFAWASQDGGVGA